MPKVKASNKTRMVVVPYDPKRRWLLRGATFALVLVAFAAGIFTGSQNYRQVVQDRDLLRQEADAARDASNKHRKRVAQLAIGSEVDQRATDAARESMAVMRKEIASLKSEISFYKGLMAPTNEERGLGIRSMDLLATKNPRKFAFKLVLQQLAVEHRLVRGDVRIDVVGRQNGNEATLPLSVLSEQVVSELIKFKFKYFQNIQADLLLPEGFEPQRIDVAVKANGAKKVSVEKKFGWLTQEA